MPEQLNRRSVLKLGATAVALTGAAGIAQAQGKHLFLTPEEFALVDEITETIIPADDKSPGARAAKVAAYIDSRLAEAFEDETRTRFRENLKLVDSASQKLHQHSFVESTAAQRSATLLSMAGNEREPRTPEQRFFRELKDYTCNGYYTSRIGIHTDMDYKGNVVQGGDYAGTQPIGPALADPASLV